MLKGFTVPKSPFGRAALTPPPPWHYSSDVVGVEFWTNAEAAAATLPSGLSPDPKSNGHAVMMFLDWQFTGSDDELTDPARYQYREAFVLVEAIFEGTPINYCPYIFVDNDAAIARGWAQGFPKKFGSIFQTRSFSAPSPAAAPLAKGSRFGASVAARMGNGWQRPVSSWRRRSKTPRRCLTAPRPCVATSPNSPQGTSKSHRSTNSPCR